MSRNLHQLNLDNEVKIPSFLSFTAVGTAVASDTFRMKVNHGTDLIKQLEQNDFCAECPCCNESFPLKDAGLFYLNDFSENGQRLYDEMKRQVEDRRHQIIDREVRIIETSKVGAQAVNIGFALERLAPCIDGFCFDRNDCRSLFDPIDYIIFEGLNKKGLVTKLFFVDIKTGRSRLTARQREIRELIANKKVELSTYKRGINEV